MAFVLLHPHAAIRPPEQMTGGDVFFSRELAQHLVRKEPRRCETTSCSSQPPETTVLPNGASVGDSRLPPAVGTAEGTQ